MLDLFMSFDHNITVRGAENEKPHQTNARQVDRKPGKRLDKGRERVHKRLQEHGPVQGCERLKIRVQKHDPVPLLQRLKRKLGGDAINTNYEVLRGGHRERDIYSELRKIEERGTRLSKKSKTPSLFGRKTAKGEGARPTLW